MHALVPANTGELHRPCQPCCDTEHDNVCNLPGVVCLPSALPFEGFATCASVALL